MILSEVHKQPSGKWIGAVDIDGITSVSPPMQLKRQALQWIEDKKRDHVLGDSGQRLMSAAIIKGLIEKKDGTAFFGSTMIYRYHFECAVRLGYVTEAKKVTRRGREWYDRCLKRLSQNRQVYWSSEGGVGLADPTIGD